MAGIPGMVAPITPPVVSSSRARYMMAGAVSSRCGSLASRLPPPAARCGAAAKLFDAPPNGKGCTGDSGSRRAVKRVSGCTSGNRAAKSGKAAAPWPGASGRMSRRRSSSSTSDIRARSTSREIWLFNCTESSFRIASESAGCQSGVSAENRKNSGAPRPRARSAVSVSHAFTPSAYACRAACVSASCAATDWRASV